MTSETDTVLRHDDVELAVTDGQGTSAAEAGRGDSAPLGTRRTAADEDDECLTAMREDIGDWLGALHGVHVDADRFLDQLDTGVLLCRHANAVHRLLARTSKDTAPRRHDTDDLSTLPLSYRLSFNNPLCVCLCVSVYGLCVCFYGLMPEIN